MPPTLGVHLWGAVQRGGQVGRGCTGWGDSPRIVGSTGGPQTCPQPCVREPRGPRPPLSCRRQPPRLSPFPVSGLLLFWVRGQGRAGPAAGNSRHVHEPPPGTTEPRRVQLCHRAPAADVPNTPGTAPSRPRPRAAPRDIPVRVGVSPARGWCRPSPPVVREEPARIWPRCLVQGVIAGPSAPASAPGTCPRAGAGTGPVPAAPPASPAAVWGW